jgi:hypothetical protein
MMKRTSSRVLIIVLVCLIAIMGSAIAYAATSSTPKYTNVPINGVSNPDDATNYIKASDSNGLISISQTVEQGDQYLWLGTKRIIGEYMYVYGYYYNSTESPNRNNLSGWKLQDADMGWGCVALDKTKTTYTDPAGVIEGHIVTWMNNCYNGCKKLTTKAEDQWQLPRIPATVKHTDYIFANCTGLKRACLTTTNVLTKSSFSGCSNLTQIFLGRNVHTITANAFNGIASGCKLYLDVASKPSGFKTGWDGNFASVKYNADVLIWPTTENY